MLAIWSRRQTNKVRCKKRRKRFQVTINVGYGVLRGGLMCDGAYVVTKVCTINIEGLI